MIKASSRNLFNPRSMFKNIRYIIEFIITVTMILIFKVIGFKKSSDFSAKLALLIGKKLKVDKLAINNINQALPKLTYNQKRDIIDQMWQNLGRIIGEFYHIWRLNLQQIYNIVSIDTKSKENIELLKKENKGGIIVSGHIGNWEVGPKALLNSGLKINILYRPLNNPYIENLTTKLRKKHGVKMIPKSNKGNKQIIQALKNNEYVVILADQKITQGHPIKFFHDLATTSTFIAKIAMRYNISVTMARVIRKNKYQFSLEINEPIIYSNIAKEKKGLDIIKFSAIINQTLEKWISQYPSQWFWVHDRWKK